MKPHFRKQNKTSLVAKLTNLKGWKAKLQIWHWADKPSLLQWGSAHCLPPYT
jgi:hypothetical protein